MPHEKIGACKRFTPLVARMRDTTRHRIELILGVEMKRAILIVIALSAPAPAFAYIDPGTGALIVQGLVGASAVVAVFFGKMKGHVQSFFVREAKTEPPVDRETKELGEGHPDVE